MYRAEFFGRDFTPIGGTYIPEPQIVYDYLTLDTTQITLPTLYNIERGSFANVTDNGKSVYQGIVSEVQQEQTTTTVQIQPLISLMDIQAYKTRDYTANCEAWVAEIISDYYITTPDPVQALPMEIITETATANVPLALEKDIHAVYGDIIIPALELAQIAVSCELDLKRRVVLVKIAKTATPTYTIEADRPNVINPTFSADAGAGSTNKVTVYNEDDPTQYLDLFAEPYSAPTKAQVAMIKLSEGESFVEKAEEYAASILDRADYDNYIEITFAKDDAIRPPESIGGTYSILHNGKAYKGILTGIERGGGLITYIFGSTRLDLTKILRLEAHR